MTTSCALMIKLKPEFTLPKKTSRQTFMELALILIVKLHASSHKRILGIINTGLLVGIHKTSVVARDVLLQLHQAAIRTRKAGRRT